MGLEVHIDPNPKEKDEEGPLKTKYMEYTVYTRARNGSLSRPEVVAYRRFSDFDWLHQRLRQVSRWACGGRVWVWVWVWGWGWVWATQHHVPSALLHHLPPTTNHQPPRQVYHGILLPPLPQKRARGNHDPDFVRERTHALTRYIAHLAHHPR